MVHCLSVVSLLLPGVILVRSYSDATPTPSHPKASNFSVQALTITPSMSTSLTQALHAQTLDRTVSYLERRRSIWFPSPLRVSHSSPSSSMSFFTWRRQRPDQ